MVTCLCLLRYSFYILKLSKSNFPGFGPWTTRYMRKERCGVSDSIGSLHRVSTRPFMMRITTGLNHIKLAFLDSDVNQGVAKVVLFESHPSLAWPGGFFLFSEIIKLKTPYMKFKHYLMPVLGSFLLCFCPLSAFAQDGGAGYRTAILDGESRFDCYFGYNGYNGETAPLRYLRENAMFIRNNDMNEAEFDALDRFVRGALADSMLYIRRIHLIGYSSIDGPYALNEKLARHRAESVRDILKNAYPELNNFPITTSWMSEDWETLYRLVRDSDMDERDEIIQMIHKVSLNALEDKLKVLNGGKPYRMMAEQFFPLLRRVEVCVEYDVPRILESRYNMELKTREAFKQELAIEKERLTTEKVAAVEDVQAEIYNQLGDWAREVNELEEGQMPEAETITAMQFKLNDLRELRRKLCPLCDDVIPFFTIKTNVLYDLTASLNLGMEFKLTRKLSLDVPVSHNPFTFGGRRKWKHTLIQPELRYWPKIVSAGHFFGAHVHLASYNVANVPGVSKTKDHRYEGWLLGPGVSYGYQHALSDYWAIEGTIGVGYAYTEYEKFDYKGVNDKIGRNKKHYVGPTKVAINIIYKFRK